MTPRFNRLIFHPTPALLPVSQERGIFWAFPRIGQNPCQNGNTARSGLDILNYSRTTSSLNQGGQETVIIDDLDSLELITEDASLFCSGGDGVLVGVFGQAIGDLSQVFAQTQTFIRALPYGGSIGIGIGFVLALEFTPPSPS